MKDSSNKHVLLLFGSLTCLAFTSIVNANGHLFVLNLENSTGLMGFREAERACASLHARLASTAELRHAVVECFFSTCTQGWLYGGTVGTTVCNVVGSALKAVDVKTENATEDFAHLNAFCIKDTGVPCGDPPSFPNALLQGHSGYEMGDELLYTCAPGFVMPSRHKAFSLLCDSCGKWYGAVEICVKDWTEGLVDYEDKFPEADGGLEDREQRAEQANGEVQEEVYGAAHTGWKPSQQHQETTFSLGQAHRDMRVEGDVAANGEKEEQKAVGYFFGHPMSEQEPGVTADATTEAPVSVLSQKHMFWFPSEAFQDDVTQRDSTIQSEESKENESQEMNNYQTPIDPNDSHHESDHNVYHNTDDHDGHDSHHDAHHERDTRQDYGDHDNQPKPYTPAQHEVQDRLDHPGNQDNRDDHYDMGEHDEDHSRTRYEGQENDGGDDTYDEHESYEDHKDVTEDHHDDDQEHLGDSQEHPDHDDNEDRDGGEGHYNQKEDDRDHYTNTADDDHDDGDHDDLSDDHDHNDHDDLSDDHDHNDHDDLSDDHDHNDHDDLSDDHDDLSDDQHDHDDHDDLNDDRRDHDDHDGDDHDDLSDDHDDLSEDHRAHDDHADHHVHDDHDEQHHHDDHDDLSDDHDDHDDYGDQHRHNDDHDDLIDRTDENDHDDGNDHNDQDDPHDSDDHSDHKDDDHNSYEDHDSQEEVKDRDYHVIFSTTRDHHQNITEMGDGGKATTDETWLDGYPVVATQLENEDSMGERSKDEDKDTGAFNEVESHKPVSHTSVPEESKPSSKEPPLQQGEGQEMWPRFIPTANPYREHAAPTQQSFINHDPAPPVHDSDAIMEEHTMNNLPGESGERGEMEGEIGETVCTGENCPPPASAGQSSKVVSIIVVVCLVAIAVMVGVWCYRRQQQKSSVYEMNGKGQSQSRPAQQMEMQQKV